MRLTIYTLTIDAASYADEAIASVPRDEHADIEHLLVHDGSDEFIEQRLRRFPFLKVVRGTGQGATAAAIQAIASASGNFIIPLNSDDRMVKGSIEALVRCAASRPDIKIWTGASRLFETVPDGTERILRRLDGPAMLGFNLGNILDDLPLLTSRFIHRSIFHDLGTLDVRYSACSDREFALRMYLAGVPEAPLGAMVTELRCHDQSQTINRSVTGIPAYLAAHIALARELLAGARLPDAYRSAIRNWLARELLRKLFYEVRAEGLAEASRTFLAATAEDPTWLWRAGSIFPAWWRRNRGTGWPFGG